MNHAHALRAVRRHLSAPPGRAPTAEQDSATEQPHQVSIEGDENVKHPNEQLPRRAYDAQGRGDIEGYIECLSDSFVLHIPGKSRIAGDCFGKDEVRRHFREIAELSGGSFMTEIHDVLAGDEHAVGLLKARVQQDGETIELPRVHVWHISQAKLAKVWLHPADQYAFDEYWGSQD
jgi:ketosteroid isomerase-like protein